MYVRGKVLNDKFVSSSLSKKKMFVLSSDTSLERGFWNK